MGAGSFALIGIGLMVEAQFGDNPWYIHSYKAFICSVRLIINNSN